MAYDTPGFCWLKLSLTAVYDTQDWPKCRCRQRQEHHYDMSDESLMRRSVHGDLKHVGVLCVLDLIGSQQLTVA